MKNECNKKRSTLLCCALALCLVSLRLSVIPCFAAAVSHAAGTAGSPAPDISRERTELAAAWEGAVSAANELYGSALWALRYVEAWNQDRTWENLCKARCALWLAADTLASYEYPVLAVRDEVLYDLAEEGAAIEVFGDYEYPREEAVYLESLLRRHLFFYLEEGWENTDFQDHVKSLSALLEEMVCFDCSEMVMETNYLLLSLQKEELWQGLQERFPVVFQEKKSWNEDPDALEKENLKALSGEIPREKIMDLMQKKIGALDNQIYSLRKGVLTQAVEPAGMPDLFPYAAWYDTRNMDITYTKVLHDGETVPLSYGDELPPPWQMQVRVFQRGISREEAEEYAAVLSRFADGTEEEGEQWRFQADGYILILSWEPEGVTIRFENQGCTFADMHFE